MHPNQQKKDLKEMDSFTEYGDANRYKILEVIGKGGYGVVCAANDTHTGEKVAIKKISDIFEDISDAIRILREVKLLRLLRHPDIVELKRIMLPPSKREFKEIYVVFELMESDLHEVIKANDDLTREHHQFFLYQMLRALKYIHTANVYHRDLKPKNILANANCKLKVCDFGLARVAYRDSPTTIFWSDYVASRWYSAPELCGSFFSKYTPAIDIWSIGCIFAEILTGKPLFPGRNIVRQLDLITDLLGTPTLETISGVQNKKARKYLTEMRKKHPVPFTQKFPKADPLALRLLQRLLVFDPKDRPTAEEALADPYFKGLARIEREPSCQPISKVEFEFERRRVTKEDIRELIYLEILEYYPQLLKDYLNGTEGTNFLYPSAIGQSRKLAYLVEHGGKSGPVISPKRNHVSLPRSTVHSSKIPPGQYRKQFAYLGEHGGKSGPVISPKRKHVSLPRSTVHSSKIPPISQQNLVLCENRLTEKASNSLRLTDAINGNPLKASWPPPRVPTDKEHKSLPEQLKGLCLYFSLFPSVYEYRKDELVQIWMAEGFIEESQSERMEDIGSAYFNSLHKIGLLVPSRCDSRVDFDSVFSVPTYNPDNLLYKVNPVKLSELVYTTAAVDYFAAMDGNLDGALEMTRYLSLNCKGIDEMTFGILKNFRHLRTLLLLSGHGSSIKHVPRDLFLSLKNLRTLSLSQTLISEVPSSIRNAKSLRYFDLSNTPITRLPESIDSLHHLQTIKLRGCVHFLQLPKGIKKLINLRHIDLDIIRQLRAMPSYLGNLTNLQTLSAFLVGREEGCCIGELKNLNDLRGVLRISRLENVSNKEEAEEAALIDKKCLQRLELRWSNVFTEKIEEQEKILECLRPHASLKELQIQHYAGSTLPTWINSPYFAELVVLTLYRCTNCQLLPSIGQLRMLKALSIIEMNEVKEINHQFFRDGQVDQAFHAFPKLEVLEIDIMFNLKEWKEVKLGDLPSLLKLTMDSCPELDSLPSLSWLKSLKHLEFRRCPKLLSLPSDGLPTSLESFIVIDCPELKERCRKAEGEDWSKIYHVPSIWFDCEEVRSKSPCRPGTLVEISEDKMELDG